MRRIWQIRGLALLLIGGVLATFAWGETIELITYFPATAQAGDLHLNSLTVGNAISNITPDDGEALIDVLLGIGITTPEHALHVVDDGTDSYVAQFEQNRATGSSRLGVINTAAANPNNTVGITFLGNSTAGETEFFSIRSSLNVTDHATRNTLTEFIQNNAGVSETVMVFEGSKVGIGTTTPSAAMLTLADSTNRTTLGSSNLLRLGGGSGASPQLVEIGFTHSTQSTEAVAAAVIGSRSEDGAVNTKRSIYFATRDTTGVGDAPTERMTIQTDGNVGIGTTTPQTTSPANFQSTGNLEVNDIYLSSTNSWVSQSGGGGGSFGAWSASLVVGTVYQAATHGFVVAGIKYTTTGFPWISIHLTGYTDSSDPPTTQRGYAASATGTAIVIGSFTMPVRAGDYWRVTKQVLTSGGNTTFIYWIPLE